MSDAEITITLPIDVARRLAVLSPDAEESSIEPAVVRVLSVLADHAQQGVYRPGSWERPWLCQVFGDEWLSEVEPDTDDLSADGRVIFDRPRMPR
jgi:hypothetical protein